MIIQTQDGRVFAGTALQIVQTMRSLSTEPAASISSYVDFVVRRANEMDLAGITGVPEDGLTDAELAKWLIDQLIDAGMARQH